MEFHRPCASQKRFRVVSERLLTRRLALFVFAKRAHFRRHDQTRGKPRKSRESVFLKRQALSSVDGKAWLDRAGETSREIRLVSRYDAVSSRKGSLRE